MSEQKLYLKPFSAVFFAHRIAQLFKWLNTYLLRVRVPQEPCFFIYFLVYKMNDICTLSFKKKINFLSKRIFFKFVKMYTIAQYYGSKSLFR